MQAEDYSDFVSLSDLHRFIPEGYASEIPSTPKSLPPDANVGDYLPSQYAEYCLRLIAAYTRSLKDALELYLPLPGAVPFHECRARTRLLSGSNQAGKTLAAMAEFARIVRGRDPFKKRADRGLLTLSVGKDLDHLGQVMWKKLWYPGAFEIVPDEVDGFWRAVRPDPNDQKHIDPIDLARKHLWQPAPPLLPPDDIQKLSYEKASEGIPSRVVLTNDTECMFYSSRGSPRAGIQIDLAHFDEEMLNKEWYREAMPRLVRRDGIFIWSATPQSSTPQLFDLHRRYLDGDKLIDEFQLLIEDNPYFSDDSKKSLFADLAAMGEEELAVRWYGNYAIHGRTVYPSYDTKVHGVEHFEIPANWMRVAAVDPGTAVSAALFGAVPPNGKELHIFSELVVKNKDAGEFARQFKRQAGVNGYEVYIIDKKGGDVKSLGRTDTVAAHYSKEFEKAGVVSSRISGRGFVYGSSVVNARELSVKRFLTSGALRFHLGSTFCLDRQIKSRYYDKNNPERREYRTEHDLCDCYDAQTEVLTDSGWKFFKNLSGAELLATVNLATDAIEYQLPSRLIDKPHCGDMVQIGGGERQRVDMLVTPGHRMVIQKQLAKVTSIIPASGLCKYDRIKAAASSWEGHDPLCPFGCDIGDFAEFLGWYVAEGSCKKPRFPGHGYSVVISQIKAESCKRLEWLLNRLPFRYCKIKDGYQLSSNKRLWKMLSPLGKSYEKRVPEWIRWASAAVIQRFLDGAVGGDGWKRSTGGFGYASTSELLAGDIQELILKTGRATSMSIREPADSYCIRGRSGGVGTLRRQYHVFTRNNPLCGLYRHDGSAPNFGTVHYDGRVYCATVPNGTLIVRRNGKVAVCGNCLEYLCAFFDDTGLYYRPPGKGAGVANFYDLSVYKSLQKKQKTARGRRIG